LGTTDNVSDPLLVFIGFRVIGCMQASATTVCRESEGHLHQERAVGYANFQN
jgi:hypothetical protein